MLTTDLLDIFRNLIIETGTEDPPGDDPPAEEDPPDDDLDDGKDEQTVPISELKKIRREAAQYRTKLRDMEKKFADLEKARKKAEEDAELAKLDEVEKQKAIAEKASSQLAALQAQMADTESKLQAKTISQAVFVAATKLGFKNPQLAMKWIDADKIEVVDGEVDDEQITAMLEELAESDPYLIEGEEEPPRDLGGGATNPKSRTGTVGPKLTDNATIAKMKRDLQADIDAGRVTGSAILEQRHRIWEASQGSKVQASRSGVSARDEARIKRRTGG